jgi:MscS family membrane protein
MKFRFDFIYRVGLLSLLIVACWSVWASAQPAAPVTTPTNAPARPVLLLLTNQLPALTFGLDSVDALNQHELLGQPLWKYLASAIYVVLAFCVAWLLDFIVGFWLGRLGAQDQAKQDQTKQAQVKRDGLLLKLLRGPVKVVAFVILINIGLGVFDWPPHAQLLLSRALIVVVACSVTYITVKIVELLLNLWRDRIIAGPDRAFADQLFPLLRNVSRIAVVVAAAVVTAENLDIKITSLLAGLSVGGLALGLAAQDTVANLFGAVAIFLDKPFHLGDLIKVEGVDGTVESIGLRSTRIRNADGHHITIPNKTMGNAIITNVTRRPAIRTEMNFGLSTQTPVEKVKRAADILGEILRSNPKTADVVISFNKFTDSALNIFVGHVWAGTDAKEHFAQLQQWNLQIKERFEAEQIDLAFPTQTIYLKAETGK